MAKFYHWKQVRHVLLDLGFVETISSDSSVLFFQHPGKGLVKLRKYEEGLDKGQIETICRNIDFPFDEFIPLCEADRKHLGKKKAPK